MKIERHMLAVLRRYLLKKHAPILDISAGIVWVPARAQDGALFMAGFHTPDCLTWQIRDTLCVVPDALQAEFSLEERMEERFIGPHARRTHLCVTNGAEYPLAERGFRLQCVPHNRADLSHSIVEELRPRFYNHRRYPYTIPERAHRFAAQVSARLEKACGNRVTKWNTEWRECSPGFVFVKTSDCGKFFCVGKC